MRIRTDYPVMQISLGCSSPKKWLLLLGGLSSLRIQGKEEWALRKQLLRQSPSFVPGSKLDHQPKKGQDNLVRNKGL